MSETKRKRVFKMLNGRCYYCGCRLDMETYHIDHYISRANGGLSEDNLVPACPECNVCKSSLTVEEFREKLMNEIPNTFQGKMLRKYYDIKPREIVFYFEKQNIKKVVS